MERTFTVFNATTGLILRTVTVDEVFGLMQLEEGEDFISGDFACNQQKVNLDTHETVAKKPLHFRVDSLQVPADGETPVTFTQLPIPTRVTWDTGSAVVEDGEVEITFDDPGSHLITLSEDLPLSLPVTLEVEAV